MVFFLIYFMPPLLCKSSSFFVGVNMRYGTEHVRMKTIRFNRVFCLTLSSILQPFFIVSLSFAYTFFAIIRTFIFIMGKFIKFQHLWHVIYTTRHISNGKIRTVLLWTRTRALVCISLYLFVCFCVYIKSRYKVCIENCQRLWLRQKKQHVNRLRHHVNLLSRRINVKLNQR